MLEVEILYYLSFYKLIKRALGICVVVNEYLPQLESGCGLKISITISGPRSERVNVFILTLIKDLGLQLRDITEKVNAALA